MNALERLWSRVLEARARRYREGRLTAARLGRPVVSVGNVTVGGTGKTPFVERLARWMLDEGRRPAILSRGYGRRSRGAVLVSDGKGGGPLVGPLEGGDEPVLLARRVPGAVVAVAGRRVEAARAAEAFSPDVFILDDGFQHLALARDLDIVLLDASDPFGGERYPPFGGLREPLSALGRAGAIVFTRPGPGAPSPAARQRVLAENWDAPRFTSEIRPAGFSDEAGRPAAAPRGPIVAACGIARPESFSQALAFLGIRPEETLIFSDHRRYDARDAARIAAAAARHCASAVVTTEKDSVKLAGKLPVPIASVRLEAEIVEPEFFAFLRGRLFGGAAAASEGRSR
ncbi:MAG TPA: tetraacyldisaccharide 4'-kinase [Thermoanaerobaculia bacterium]